MDRQTCTRGATIMALVLATLIPSDASGRQDGATGPVTFTQHIAPIVYANCATCHNARGPAPFSLLTYDDVASRAQLVTRVTQRRYMPPWLPDSGYGHFAGERRLHADDIALIKRWAESGALHGPGDAPPPPAPPDDWTLGTPDLIVSAPRVEVSPHTTDVYRNLVIEIPVAETKFVRSVELRPGGTNVVHHARMMIDSTDSSRLLDAEDPAPGFDGMELVSDAHNPDGFFVGWTPGKVPHRTAPDMAWRLDPGTDVVLQLHLPASTEPQIAEPQIGLYFADRPPRRRPVLLMLGSFDIDIPPGESSYVVTDSYDVPVDVSVLALYPHAHYLGKTIEGFAELPDGRTRWLIRISDWDFNWQDEYHLADPVDVPAGSKLHMRITFDNSARNPRNPNEPPQRVVYGSNSTDEMADLVVQLLPKDESDFAFLRRDINLWQYRAVASWMASQDHQAGLALAAEGRFEEAIDAFRSAVSYVNDSPQIHNDLGAALAMSGNAEIGVVHFREAARLDPTWAEPAINLAMTQLALGTPDGLAEALTSAERAAQLTGRTDPAVLDVLARALAANEKQSDAVRAAERALQLAVEQGLDELAERIRRRLAARRERR